MVSESAVPGRALAGLPTNGSPDCTSELWAVPPVGEFGEPAEYPPGLLPLSDLAIPICPLPLDRVVDGLRAVDVVPHPRYPPPSASLMSDGSSPLLLAPPTTGSVGSLLGLNPYSSTSFLRSSSASFRCFRLRQKKRATSTINATAATGTTTATAILPPGESPPELFVEVADEVERAAAFDAVDDECLVEVCRVDLEESEEAGCVDVMTIVRVGSSPEGVIITSVTDGDGVVGTLAADEVSAGLEDVRVICGDGELVCGCGGVDETGAGGVLEGDVRDERGSGVEEDVIIVEVIVN